MGLRLFVLWRDGLVFSKKGYNVKGCSKKRYVLLTRLLGSIGCLYLVSPPLIYFCCYFNYYFISFLISLDFIEERRCKTGCNYVRSWWGFKGVKSFFFQIEKIKIFNGKNILKHLWKKAMYPDSKLEELVWKAISQP